MIFTPEQIRQLIELGRYEQQDDEYYSHLYSFGFTANQIFKVATCADQYAIKTLIDLTAYVAYKDGSRDYTAVEVLIANEVTIEQLIDLLSAPSGSEYVITLMSLATPQQMQDFLAEIQELREPSAGVEEALYEENPEQLHEVELVLTPEVADESALNYLPITDESNPQAEPGFWEEPDSWNEPSSWEESSSWDESDSRTKPNPEFMAAKTPRNHAPTGAEYGAMLDHGLKHCPELQQDYLYFIDRIKKLNHYLSDATLAPMNRYSFYTEKALLSVNKQHIEDIASLQRELNILQDVIEQSSLPREDLATNPRVVASWQQMLPLLERQISKLAALRLNTELLAELKQLLPTLAVSEESTAPTPH